MSSLPPLAQEARWEGQATAQALAKATQARLGYRISRIDLPRAWEEERQEYKRQAQS